MLDMNNNDPVVAITEYARDLMAKGHDVRTAIALAGVSAGLALIDYEAVFGPNIRSRAMSDVIVDLAEQGPIHQRIVERLTTETAEV